MAVTLTHLAGLAEELPSSAPWALGVRGGTIGLGAEAVWPAAEWCTLRLAAHGGRFDLDERIRDVRYGVDLKFANAGLLADVHAPQGSFRFTAGLVYNANEWSAYARPERATRIGGLTFSPSEIGTIRGEADVSPLVGYAGIGFGNPWVGGRWTITLDLGVWWLPTSPHVRLTADGTASGWWLFQEALKQEERDLAAQLPRWWPVVMLGVVFRFG